MPKVPVFLGLDFAQWAVILREIVKAGGAVLVVTGTWTTADAAQISQGLETIIKGATFFGGGSMILGPIIWQIWQRAATARIKDVAALPTVKGIVTDVKTAQVDLKGVPNVVADAHQIPKEKVA